MNNISSIEFYDSIKINCELKIIKKLYSTRCYNEQLKWIKNISSEILLLVFKFSC